MRLVGDGRLGHAADGPYNAIHVGAAAETLPQTVSTVRSSEENRHMRDCDTHVNGITLSFAVDRPTSSRRSTDLPGRGHRRFPKVPRPAAGGQEHRRRDHEEETDASLIRSSHGSYHTIT